MTAWVQAQNGGDFKAYSKLYAEKFTGTKKVGERSMDFGRAAWLEDRAEMFQKPFSVMVNDLHITSRGGSISPPLLGIVLGAGEKWLVWFEALALATPELGHGFLCLARFR